MNKQKILELLYKQFNIKDEYIKNHEIISETEYIYLKDELDQELILTICWDKQIYYQTYDEVTTEFNLVILD